ncbi:MAG: hypothetical protein Q9170_008003, partial [Blastenia crenularia]
DEVHQVLAELERQKSLLNLALMNDSLQLSKAIHEEVRKVSQGVEAMHVQQENERRKITLSRMSAIDFDTIHEAISSRRAEGTGQWLLQSEEFASWLECSTGGTLWFRGIPGSGKTVLASLVLDHVRSLQNNDPSIGVAGIYCNYADPHPIIAMLGSVLQQLARHSGSVPESVFQAKSLTISNISEPISDVASAYKQIFLVIDALDECLDRLNTQRAAHAALGSSRSGLMDIERNIGADRTIEILSKDSDVRLYLHKSLHDHDRLSRCVSAIPKLERSIIETIVQKLSGMFLLARLYIDRLAEEVTPRGIRQAVRSLPEGINETYAEAWGRIGAQKSRHADIGKKVLSWTICSLRPLHKEELRHGLAIEIGDKELDEEGLLDDDDLTSFCAGLVVVDRQSHQVSLVHQTTNEYFAEANVIDLAEAHNSIATACLTSILMDSFRFGVTTNLPNLLLRYPWYEYAASNWSHHFRLSASKSSMDLVLRFLKDEQVKYATAQILIQSTKKRHHPNRALPLSDHLAASVASQAIEPRRLFFPNASSDLISPSDAAPLCIPKGKEAIGPLHLAAYFGLTELGYILLQQGHSATELDRNGLTPLHWAIANCQHDMQKFLIQHAADVNYILTISSRYAEENISFASPLHLASSMGDILAMEILIQHHAVVDKVAYGRNPLAAAVMSDQVAGGKLLITEGANTERSLSQEDFYSLCKSPESCAEILATILRGGLSSCSLRTLLNMAADYQVFDSMKLLFQAGVGSSIFVLQSSSTEARKTTGPNIVPTRETYTKIEVEDGSDDDSYNDEVSCVPHAYSIGVSKYINNKSPESCKIEIERGTDPYLIRFHIWKCGKKWTGPNTLSLYIEAHFGLLVIIRMLIGKGAEVDLHLDEHIGLHKRSGRYSAYKVTQMRAKATIQLLWNLGAGIDVFSDDDDAMINELPAFPAEDANLGLPLFGAKHDASLKASTHSCTG